MKFTELLNQYNIRYITEGNHHCRPGWIQLDCPFCGRDTGKYHMGYSLAGRYLNCWRCGGHAVGQTLSELTGLTIKKCITLTGSLIKETSTKEKVTGKLIVPATVPLNASRRHVQYLSNRGFNYKQIAGQWNVEAIRLHAKLSWRLFIPVIYKGNIVSWTTRSISKQKNILRYISASEEQEAIPHKNLLYGEDFATNTIVICEGPLDVWAIGEGAVAVCGTSYSQAQLLKMTKYTTRAICFDNTKEAQARAEKLSEDLSVFDGDTFNIQLDAKDPAEASSRELDKLRKAFLR